jgi:hypothetical protein
MRTLLREEILELVGQADEEPFRPMDIDHVQAEINFRPTCRFRFHAKLHRKIAKDGASQEIKKIFMDEIGLGTLMKLRSQAKKWKIKLKATRKKPPKPSALKKPRTRPATRRASLALQTPFVEPKTNITNVESQVMPLDHFHSLGKQITTAVDDVAKRRASKERSASINAVKNSNAVHVAIEDDDDDDADVERSTIVRNEEGSEEPHSTHPELWNIDGTEMDLNQQYKTGGQMW